MLRHPLLTLGLVSLVASALFAAQAARALSPMGGLLGHGHSNQGYLGINFRDVSKDEVSTLKLKDAHGAEIILVDHDGPGCRSGLREHDVILQMNGQAIQGEGQLRHMLHEIPVGGTVSFVISRDGQQQSLSTQLVDRETLAQEAWERHYTVPEPTSSGLRGSGFFGGGGGASSVEVPHHGLFGSSILSSSYTGALLEVMGPQLADYFGAQTGLLVRSVEANSPAEAAGMRAGDVVIRLNDQAVSSNDDWLKTVHDNRGKPLPVVILRDRKEQTLTLVPDSRKRSSADPQFLPMMSSHIQTLVGFLRLPDWMH